MTLFEQANTLAQSGQLGNALEIYAQLLTLEPSNAAAWNNQGHVQDDLGQHEAALDSFNHALAIHPQYVQALCNKGVALSNIQKHSEAMQVLSECIAIAPHFASAYSNRGNAHRALHQYDLALADYVLATELEPTLANAHWNESTCRLHMGEYDLGWKKHEWRWEVPAVKNQTSDTPRTTWKLGDPIAGKSFTIWPEGGYGDALQFTRFAHDLKQLGATVSIAAPPPLLALYQDSFQGFDIIPMVDAMPMPPSDYHCSIMSLPMICGITSLDKLVTPIPYLFANLDKNAKWQKRLSNLASNQLRVGLTWAGNPLTGSDLERSLQLRHFENLAALAGSSVQFFSLQKGKPSEQIAQTHKLHLIDFTNELIDWSDTAALVNQLDLVISCDTANAHLAGALGKPTWILSRYNGCWRWLIDRTDSPWYPSIRLFRQPTFGDWETVMHDVAQALAAQLANT